MIKKIVLIAFPVIAFLVWLSADQTNLGNVNLEFDDSYIEEDVGGILPRLYLAVLRLGGDNDVLDNDENVPEISVTINLPKIFSELGLEASEVGPGAAIIYGDSNIRRQVPNSLDAFQRVTEGVAYCAHPSEKIAEDLFVQGYAQFYQHPSGVGGEFGKCGQKQYLLKENFEEIIDVEDFYAAKIGHCNLAECELTFKAEQYEIENVDWPAKHLNRYYDLRKILVEKAIRVID